MDEGTFDGQSRLAVEIPGQSLVFDPLVRPDELARDVDVSAVRADGRISAHGHLGPVADAVELAGRPGASVTANPPTGSALCVIKR